MFKLFKTRLKKQPPQADPFLGQTELKTTDLSKYLALHPVEPIYVVWGKHVLAKLAYHKQGEVKFFDYTKLDASDEPWSQVIPAADLTAPGMWDEKDRFFTVSGVQDFLDGLEANGL